MVLPDRRPHPASTSQLACVSPWVRGPLARHGKCTVPTRTAGKDARAPRGQRGFASLASRSSGNAGLPLTAAAARRRQCGGMEKHAARSGNTLEFLLAALQRRTVLGGEHTRAHVFGRQTAHQPLGLFERFMPVLRQQFGIGSRPVEVQGLDLHPRVAPGPSCVGQDAVRSEAGVLAAGGPGQVTQGLQPMVGLEHVDPIAHLEPAHQGKHLVGGPDPRGAESSPEVRVRRAGRSETRCPVPIRTARLHPPVRHALPQSRAVHAAPSPGNRPPPTDVDRQRNSPRRPPPCR
jgi:hypothetical protein